MTATAPEATTQPTIRLATPADRENVIAALTSGFSNDVIISGWLFNDADTYTRYASGYFACYTDFAIEHGCVWTTGDSTGALIAMPYQAWELSGNDAVLKERMVEAAGPYTEKVAVLDAALTPLHPTSIDHLYLAFVAVAPEHHSEGIGSKMLQELFDLADTLQLPIYGEASCERNSRLYTRIGMPPHSEPFTLPGSEAPIIPFWRAPTPHLDLTHSGREVERLVSPQGLQP